MIIRVDPSITALYPPTLALTARSRGPFHVGIACRGHLMSLNMGENPTSHPGQKDWSHGATISMCRILTNTAVTAQYACGNLVAHAYFFPTRSNKGCTIIATTICTLHWYAVNIVKNTWLATAQRDRATIADCNGPRLTLLRHSYIELWLREHPNLFVMGLFDSLCWLL